MAVERRWRTRLWVEKFSAAAAAVASIRGGGSGVVLRVIDSEGLFESERVCLPVMRDFFFNIYTKAKCQVFSYKRRTRCFHRRVWKKRLFSLAWFNFL